MDAAFSSLTFLEAKGPCQTQPNLTISCQPSPVCPGLLPPPMEELLGNHTVEKLTFSQSTKGN